MSLIPEAGHSLLVRTDHGDDAAWEALCAAVREPVGEFRAYVTTISDPAHDIASIDEIVRLASGSDRTFLFVADHAALSDPEHPVLVVDLLDQPGRTFRVIPSEAWSVENNLSLANMDFDEFAIAVDERGVFRGFGDGEQP